MNRTSSFVVGAAGENVKSALSGPVTVIVRVAVVVAPPPVTVSVTV